jgi:hypothetical protein
MEGERTLPKAAAVVFFLALLVIALPHASSSSYYTLTVTSAHGTTFGSGAYANGTTASFGVSPTVVYDSTVTRYIFTGWSCSGSGCYSGGSNTASITMQDAVEESANWMTQYLLSVSSTGSGSVSITGGWYDSGSTASVSETPQAGWVFAYWELDGSNVGSSHTYTVTMDGPHTLTANFIKVEIDSTMLNVTDQSMGTLRNPDGTFYRGDEFAVEYNVSITGSALPDTVSVIPNFIYPRTALTETKVSGDYASFTVLATAVYAPYNVTIQPMIHNSVDGTLRPVPVSTHQPFAVVRYDPYFSYFTYMDYNSLNSTSYARPFVTLVRYDGNSPGYSYSGDINTDPFSAGNATGERAVINNFTFSTVGFSSSTNSSFASHDNLDLGIRLLNKTTTPVIAWGNRVEKYYFMANMTEIDRYLSEGIVYFNVTESARSYDFAGSNNSNLFNTSYLYEPLFYNGYLVFSGSSQDNVTITSYNPNPLDPYLISNVISVFGNDSKVISAFTSDLYEASSSFELKPIAPGVYLVNQTNIATITNPQMPYLEISVSGPSGSTTYEYTGNPPSYLGSPTVTIRRNMITESYTVSDEFSLFQVTAATNQCPSSAFQFPSLFGYYVNQSFVMLPLDFNFSHEGQYLVVMSSNNNGCQLQTIDTEPGNITQLYSFLYGSNLTVPISLTGGGIGLIGSPEPVAGGTQYVLKLFISSQGAKKILVMSDSGTLLATFFPPDSWPAYSSYAPSGYFGEYSIQFPVANISTVTVEVVNSWGAVTYITNIPVKPSEVSPPTWPEMLISLLLMATVFLYIARRLATRRR